MVDEEQGRVARDLGRAVRRVVDRHDERVGAEPVVGHHLARTGPNDATVTTTSAPAMASRAVAWTCASAMPGVARASSASASARSRVAIEDARRAPGSTLPEDREVASALDAGADERGTGTASTRGREVARSRRR